ncbi:hypothetical protein TNCV_3380111 [Trichonephila clavipes]|nr:hypothetical protein TNCV_3380111 [Trichonephila clavipes]
MAPWARRLGCVLALDKCIVRCGQGTMAPWARRLACFGVLCANRTREVKRDFGDLPIRRSEGRVVNTPLVFKMVLFEKKRTRGEEKEQEKGQESLGERTDGRRGDGKERETEREPLGERESEARLEWRQGLSPETGVKRR